MSADSQSQGETNGISNEAESSEVGNGAVQKAKRKRVVVAGLGMVGVSFAEKLLKLDAKRSEYYLIVIGEEPHLAYNRVGLTSYCEYSYG